MTAVADVYDRANARPGEGAPQGSSKGKKGGWGIVPLCSWLGVIWPTACLPLQGGIKCKTWKDNWTVVTADGGLCAQYEHTLLITPDGVEILTKA